ncbi:TonB-dependent receptor plug domain-containing protein [Tannerella forsythia]|uniref:TonB-dependent receptor n=1 Tax=Tannerella forsythia TaxID=28112 RepID=A0A3P1XNK3_TANFO|nr:TonB-dependent receptor [Tannerella forsythia]RRD59656.1 TonB-dependent receptor [Tannerella forsythia]
MRTKKRLNDQQAFRFRRFVRKAYSAFNSMHKVVNIGVLTSSMLAFAHLSPVSAQQGAGTVADKMPEEELDEVTVTAARVETPLAQSARLVTVITRAQIEQAPVQSLQELLAYAAHIDVIQRGGHGVQADISIRGGSADQTAILLNGINLTNPHTGHYNLDLPVNLSDIERIEIIHGPSALIYGSGAFSGGINIITKKEIDARVYANAEAGMHNLWRGDVRGAAEIGRTKNSLSAGYQSSDGYIPHSDYRMYNLLWQTRWKARENAYLDIQLGYNNKHYGANTFYSAKFSNQYERTSAYMATLKGSFGQTLRVIPILYWSRHYDQFDLIKDTPKGRNFHRGDTYGANLIFQYTSRIGTTTLGGEVRREDIVSSKLGKPRAHPEGDYTKYDDRTTSSVTLEHTYATSRFSLSAGALVNYNTLTDAIRFYPSVSAAYRPAEGLKIATTWSQSTRMPTFTDLYYTQETHHANEHLKPERSESVDLGVTYDRPLVSAYVKGFLMWGRDMIDWVRTSGDAKWASWNLTEVDKQGVEIGATLRPGQQWPTLGHSELSISYARMNQTADSKGLESKYLLNYLRDKLTVQLRHPVYRNFSAAWHFRLQKRMGNYRRFEGGADAGLHPYPAFSVLDLKLNYKLRNVDLHVNLNNLYDTQYYDVGNVPQAGFWLMGGVTYRLK